MHNEIDQYDVKHVRLNLDDQKKVKDHILETWTRGGTARQVYEQDWREWGCHSGGICLMA